MWVEADCNLSGLESLARQFVCGRAFFKKHFARGKRRSTRRFYGFPTCSVTPGTCPGLSKRPDSSTSLPSRSAGANITPALRLVLLAKGSDGTKVLTHFSTTPEVGSPHAGTYNATATPEQNLGTWRNFQQKDVQQDPFIAYGYSEGGGGPTRAMLKNISLIKDFPGVPKMRYSTAKNFFETLEKTSGDSSPTWDGKLYLELHRGTYTSQGRNTCANRKSEFLLHDAAFVASLASTLDTDYSYPEAELQRTWELTLLNQFHDIITRSSIGEVYSESLAQYEEVKGLGEAVRNGPRNPSNERQPRHLRDRYAEAPSSELFVRQSIRAYGLPAHPVAEVVIGRQRADRHRLPPLVSPALVGDKAALWDTSALSRRRPQRAVSVQEASYSTVWRALRSLLNACSPR